MFLISAGKLIDVANMEASNREHAAILGALAERDPESAARLAVYHAQSLRERFAEHFNGLGAPSAQGAGVGQADEYESHPSNRRNKRKQGSLNDA